MTWRKSDVGSDEPEGYQTDSGVQPDLEAAKRCTLCLGRGWLACSNDHYVVRKQRNTVTGEERIVSTGFEVCFGHLCHVCQQHKIREEQLRTL